MPSVSRWVSPGRVRALRERLGLSAEALGAALELGESAVEGFERVGAPPWAAYALLGLAIDELGLSPNEARHLLGLADAGDPRSGEE